MKQIRFSRRSFGRKQAATGMIATKGMDAVKGMIATKGGSLELWVK